MKQIRNLSDLQRAIFRKDSFTNNLIIFGGASVLAYAIGFVFTPFITRIYSPPDYGRLALFNSITAFLISFNFLNYHEALILPKSGKKYFQLSGLIVLMATAFSSVCLILLIFFLDSIEAFFGVGGIGYLYYFIPLILILNALQVIAEYKNVRDKQFRINARARVASVTTAKSSTLIIGLLYGSTAVGLVIGEILIRVVNILIQLGSDSRNFFRSLLSSIRVGGLQSVAHEYRNYPRFLFPASLFMQLTVHLPVFLFGKIYDPQTLGYYSLAITLLGIPVMVIGFAVGKVFLQKVNELKDDQSETEIKHLMESYLFILTIIGVLGYGIIFGFGPMVFRLIAGSQWTLAGEYARILAIPLLFHLINISIGPVFVAFRKEKMKLWANVISSMMMVLILIAGILYDWEPMQFVYLIGAALLVRNILFFLFTISISPLNTLKVFGWIIPLVVAGFGLFYLLGMLFQDFPFE